jgi:hypothetical protein
MSVRTAPYIESGARGGCTPGHRGTERSDLPGRGPRYQGRRGSRPLDVIPEEVVHPGLLGGWGC